ncbi:methyl-accepting chemotaxis protein [Piscinibacter sp.]|uniref:methyl-accepting chemotaxis protein n=1 Tax=Piscinibacter sp. TaxID=1903157 RepID=UPI0035B35CF2
MRLICDPMERACEVAGRIAGGDLTSTITTHGSDEPARMMEALRHMQQSLGAMVSEVRARSDSIRTACSEVAAGNQDLSQRTEQTASSLQQTSSSMEQLTGTVRQTAESGRMANQLAKSAAEAAQRGGQVVSQVVANMNEISTASRKIADITSVIDGIAFQTNILALNAAVEAASAGEQGRGFSVVAAEVRSLAQRSANAAREIKTLIEGSVEWVDSGSRLVQTAGTTMTEIVTGVQQVTHIIAEITAATARQSNDLAQMNAAVAQLDQMTQQNAALVEEGAAAAASLNSQAERLTSLVSRFRCADALAGDERLAGSL